MHISEILDFASKFDVGPVYELVRLVREGFLGNQGVDRYGGTLPDIVAIVVQVSSDKVPLK